MSGLGVERVDERVRRKWWGGEDRYEPRKPKVRWEMWPVVGICGSEVTMRGDCRLADGGSWASFGPCAFTAFREYTIWGAVSMRRRPG